MKDKTLGNINYIEPFSTHDGKGIRMVLFLQGCNFKCLYCHNRDTWSFEEKKLMSSEEILEEFLKYKEFYKNGGLTVSGGEPLCQIDFLIELFSLFKSQNIHITLDTSGQTFNYSDEENIKIHDLVFDLVDTILLDVKSFNDDVHKKITDHSNANIIALLSHLDTNFLINKGKELIIRYVLVPALTDNMNDITNFISFLSTLKHKIKVEVLGYHTLGIYKWEKLAVPYKLSGIKEPNNSEIIQIQALFDEKI